LVQLAKTCKTRYNAVLSSHVNLDDAYRHSKDWDERYVVATGSPVADEPMGHGSVCHTRDTETGAVFRRLEAFLSDFPVEKSLHFDNLRLTNTYGCAGWEDIGVLEELVCGVTPVIEWLKEHDITVTTEGYNGMPIDPSCLVSGFWHHDPPDRMRQILHRRISGGGRGSHFGQHTPYDYGICNSIHFDISAQPLPPDNLPADVKEKYFGWLRFPRVTWTFEENRKAILDCIYLGTLLHHFYNEREMLVWDDVGDGHRVVYAGGVVAEIRLHGPDSLRVICGDMTIADGGDRFIPRSGAVYAYSRDGSDRLWTLPDTLRNRPLAVHLLTETGRKPAVGWKISGNAIHLCLLPGEPVKIEPV
ncbi:MAG: hypothetical protein FJY97_20405, partial [candidate division Zixibacteria bacterium]|nr:hypothetical protein [candidate division Zixibacteria bacterium]